MQVKIVTPATLAFEENAEEIQVPGWDGEFGVLDGHAKLLSLTRPGVVVVHNTDGKKRLLVGKGFAEIGSEHISLLVDLCESVEDIDKEAAQKDLDAALSELADLNISDAGYAFVKNRVDLAQARLDA